MSDAKIQPEFGSPLTWLEKEGLSVSSENFEFLAWEKIECDKLPVCLIEMTTNLKQNAFILFNKAELNKYRIPNSNVQGTYHYYLVAIEKLWDVSNLEEYRAFIEEDRIHSMNKFEATEELLDDIVEKLNKTKTVEDISRERRIPVRTVKYIAQQLRNRGVLVETSGRASVKYDVYIRNLARRKPELLNKETADRLTMSDHLKDPYKSAPQESQHIAPKGGNGSKSKFHCLYCDHATAGITGIYQHTRKHHPGKKKWK